MYDVALSVLACLGADTVVHVAWIASDDISDGTQAVALTPGGGQIGSLLGGALDDAITQALPTIGDSGGIVDIALGPAESLISGLPQETVLAVAIAPGTAIPKDILEALASRQARVVCLHPRRESVQRRRTPRQLRRSDQIERSTHLPVPTGFPSSHCRRRPHC